MQKLSYDPNDRGNEKKIAPQMDAYILGDNPASPAELYRQSPPSSNDSSRLVPIPSNCTSRVHWPQSRGYHALRPVYVLVDSLSHQGYHSISLYCRRSNGEKNAASTH